MNGEPMGIRECDPEAAEAVLVLRLSIPNLIADDKERFTLNRRPAAPLAESVAHCSHANGRLPDGRVFGFGKTVSIAGRDADTVAVRVSLYWTARDGTHGDADDELTVPWLGEVEKELAGGVKVNARIVPPGG